MKNLILATAAILFSVLLNAQTFSVVGGFNMSDLRVSSSEGDIDNNQYSLKPGFHFGFRTDIRINEFLSFAPAVLFSTKGTSMSYEYERPGFEFNGVILEEAVLVKVDSDITLQYLDIPLALQATHQLNDRLRVYGALGPYLGIGLYGKQKGTTESNGEKESSELVLPWGNDPEEDFLQRLDMGITIGAGIEIEKVLVGLSFDTGLSNISTYQEEGARIENKVLRFTVGYQIGSF